MTCTLLPWLHHFSKMVNKKIAYLPLAVALTVFFLSIVCRGFQLHKLAKKNLPDTLSPSTENLSVKQLFFLLSLLLHLTICLYNSPMAFVSPDLIVFLSASSCQFPGNYMWSNQRTDPLMICWLNYRNHFAVTKWMILSSLWAFPYTIVWGNLPLPHHSCYLNKYLFRNNEKTCLGVLWW